MKRVLLLICLVFAAPIAFDIGSAPAAAEEASKKKKKDTRRMPAITERTYKALASAQALIDPESIAEEDRKKNWDPTPRPREGIQVLLDMLDRRSLNSYEAAQIWNLLAFGYYTIEDTAKTIDAYENLLAQEKITLALELSALRALYQLYYAGERYLESIEYMDKYLALKEEADPQISYLKANAYFQMKDWNKSLEMALQCEQEAIDLGKEVKESWLYLQVVLYSELKRPVDTIRVLETLVVRFPKKQYWMHLAGLYSEEEAEDRALSAFYAAYVQGMLTRENEVVMLAQRLLSQEVPYEAASVLESAFKEDRLTANEKNLKLLAQAYTMSKDYDDAINAWRRTAKAGEDGDNYYRLAQSLANEDRHEEAVDAFKDALKLDVKSVPDVHFWLGVSLMQMGQWDNATRAFREASKDDDQRMKKSCRQYIRYIASEKRRERELKKMLET